MNAQSHSAERTLREQLLVTENPVIDALAKKTHTQRNVVKRLYETELAALSAEARVTGFLSVLACRRVKEVLRARKASAGAASGVRLPTAAA